MKAAVWTYCWAMATCVAVQAALGADLLLLVLFSAIALSAAPALLRQDLRVSDVLYVSYCLYHGGLALAFKSLLMQPVQANLFAIDTSATVLVLAHAALTLAYLLARATGDVLPARGVMARPFVDPGFLRFFSLSGFGAGLALHILHFELRADFGEGLSGTSGFGGFGEFYFLMLFAFAAQIFLTVRSPRPSNLMLCVVMFGCFVAAAFAGNIKKDIFDATAIVLLAAVTFRFRISPLIIASGAVSALFLIFVASPLIHITRAGDTGDVGGRLAEAMRILEEEAFDPWRLNDRSERLTMGYARNYSAQGSYFYPSTANIDRFALILPIDQVARADDPGRVSWNDVVRRVAEGVLPSVLIGKSPGALADFVGWAYGFREHGRIARPVVGLAASAHAVAGLPGVVLAALLLPFCLFLAVDFVSGRLANNPFGVGLAVTLSQMAEKEIDAILIFLLRGLPVILVTILLFTALHTLLRRAGRSPVTAGRA